MCEWFDETYGSLVNHIDQSGIKEDTLIIYVCDNGWIQTEKGSYAERSKRSPMSTVLFFIMLMAETIKLRIVWCARPLTLSRLF